MSVLKGYLDRFGVPTASDSTILELVKEKPLGNENVLVFHPPLILAVVECDWTVEMKLLKFPGSSSRTRLGSAPSYHIIPSRGQK